MKINSFEGLAAMMAENFHELRQELHQGVGDLTAEVRNSTEETRKLLNRHDTRISALDYKTFGTADSDSIIKRK